MSNKGYCNTCYRYYAHINQHNMVKHGILTEPILSEPTLCDCDKPEPISYGFGECRKCHRLIQKYAWVNDKTPSLPK